MKSSILLNRLVIIIILNFIALGLSSQERTNSDGYVPHVGQEGKDVIWVPTPDELVDKMLEIAGVTEKDFVIDLGSGNGKTVIAAAKLGANALGIEYNPDMVALSINRAKEAGVSDKAKFIKADLFEYDFSRATVITMFLLPDINIKLRPRLLDLKPGTRIVSNTFTMGEWSPDFEATTEENWNSWNSALMWIIPAKVEGTWKLQSGELTIRQEYQMIYGSFESDTKRSTIKEGRLDGSDITFSLDGEIFTGVVSDNKTMKGTVTTSSGKTDWTAIRKED